MLKTLARFRVYGLPQPGGSKRAFVIPPRTGPDGIPFGKHRANVVDANPKVKDWKQAVAAAAREAYQGAPVQHEVCLEVTFFMPRPKSDYRTGKYANELKANAPMWHTNEPDLTKLVRSTEDALTHILWNDDRQVAKQLPQKIYGDRPGAMIVVRARCDEVTT